MPDVKRVSPAEAYQLMGEGYTYVDVRSEPEFEAGHPAGALNVPWLRAAGTNMAPNQDFLPVMKRVFPSDARLVVGCQGGERALRAAELLLAQGFTQVVEQRAGFGGSRTPFGALREPGWERAGLPVERGAPAGRCYGDVLAAGRPER
jgi:rhodanese-related sulfurtransferase